MTSSIWFNTLWVVAILTALSRLAVLRRRRESPARILLHGQPVVFTTRAVVQFYVRGTWGHGWGGLNERGRQELLVHSGGLEVIPGAFDGSVSINTMMLKGASMCRDRLGAWPLVVGNHECIRLSGNDGARSSEWKVSPRGTPIDAVWAELVAAGVTPIV
jgi:hypothetical protein